MKITAIYIISQIITIVYYGMLCSSFLLKSRNKILFANLAAHIGQIIAMALLNGLTGSAMAFIMMLRDLGFYIQDKYTKNNSRNKEKSDLIIFIGTIILVLALTLFTYNGLLSLLSVVATLISTFALWQKNVKYYKLLGIIGGILWLSYNVYIKSIMGITLEIVLAMFSIVGFIKENKSSI